MQEPFQGIGKPEPLKSPKSICCSMQSTMNELVFFRPAIITEASSFPHPILKSDKFRSVAVALHVFRLPAAQFSMRRPGIL